MALIGEAADLDFPEGLSVRESDPAPALRLYILYQRTGQTKQAEELLAKALRPFLLRRTKEQVAKDLPRKTEQTVDAEMEPPQI